MATSKLQQKTRERLHLLFSHFHVIENYRPNWLKNAASGKNLEIDFYFPDVHIGIEVQGEQHGRYVPFFHGNEDGFRGQVERDNLKKQLCRDNGVYLFEVYSPEDIDGFIEAVKGHSTEMYFELVKKNTAIKSLAYYAARLHVLSTQERKMINRDSDGRQKQMAAITGRMIHITTKYNLRLTDIRPDFSISRLEMSFAFKPIVKIRRYGTDAAVTDRAALLNWNLENLVGVIAWLHKGKRIELEIDLRTGRQLKKDLIGWEIDLDTLPDWLKKVLGD
jgi:YesN/AraC family two-component response regulator